MKVKISISEKPQNDHSLVPLSYIPEYNEDFDLVFKIEFEFETCLELIYQGPVP